MRFRLFVLVSLLLVLVAACAPQAAPFTNTPLSSPTETVADQPKDGEIQPPVETQAPTQAPVEGVALPGEVQPVISKVAESLGVEASTIQVKSFEAVQWRTACLGVQHPGMMCAQVITPGYRIIFSTLQGDLEVHTDQSGSQFVIAENPQPAKGSPLVSWERSGGFAGKCTRLIVEDTGRYQLSACEGGKILAEGKLIAGQISPLNEYSQRYGEFQYELKPPTGSADMFTDRYTFSGTGHGKPTKDVQEQLNEYLAKLASELQRTGVGN